MKISQVLVLAVAVMAASAPSGTAHELGRTDEGRQGTVFREAPSRPAATFPIDIHVVIVCRDEGERQIAQRLASQLAPVADAIAAGTKLTKADAARMGLPESDVDEIDDFRDWFLATLSRRHGRGIYVFAVTHSPTVSPPLTSARQSVGGCPPGCVPPVCEFCFRLLDFEGPKLEFHDDSVPPFTPGGLGGSGGSGSGSSSGAGGGASGGTGSGGSGGGGSGGAGSGGSGGGSGGAGGGRLVFDPQRPIVVIVLEKPGDTHVQIEDLVRETLKSSMRQPITARLVIKTRSVPHKTI